MIRLLFVFLVAIVMLSCSFLPPAINMSTAVGLTLTALPTNTLLPSETPIATFIPPTLSPAITQTPTPDPILNSTLAIARNQMTTALTEWLKSQPVVSYLHTVQFKDNNIQAELRTCYATKERQPEVSYQIIQGLADMLSGLSMEHSMLLANGGVLSLDLITYSIDNLFKYESVTTYPTLLMVASKSITYDDWVRVSGAGFK
jgi:hypothetical protein